MSSPSLLKRRSRVFNNFHMNKTKKAPKKSNSDENSGLTEAQTIEMLAKLAEAVVRLERIGAAMQIQLDDLSGRVQELEDGPGCHVRTFTYSR